MRRYTATLIAEFSIEAENIVQAKRAAKAIRAVGARFGARKPGANDRDFIRHHVNLILETVSVVPRSRSKEGRGTSDG